MSDQANPAVEQDAFLQMEQLLEGPEGELEEEEQPAEASEEESEAPETDEDEEAQPEETPEEVEELSWNGETKKVTKSELKELAQKGFDYTQKTQQLADERRQVESAIRQAQQSIALQNQQVELIAQVKALDSQLAQFQGVNWHQLAEQDPVEYLKLNQTYRDLKESRDGSVHQFQQQAHYMQQMHTHQQQEVLQREAAKLAELPDFKGEKAQQTRQQIKSFLREEGFSDEEVAGVMDSRHVKVAWKAAQWDRLQKSKPQVQKKVADVPRVVKAGTNKPAPNKAAVDARAKLKSTGRQEYAASLIEKML